MQGCDPISAKDAVVSGFQHLCAARGIAVNELANFFGVTPSTAYSMMDGERRDISITTIKEFCDGLDISLLPPKIGGVELE